MTKRSVVFCFVQPNLWDCFASQCGNRVKALKAFNKYYYLFKKMRNYLITLFTIAAMTGCNNSMTFYTATEDVSVYENVNDYPSKADFVISADTVCEMGKISFGKVDAYIEVQCPNVHGWILAIDKDKFRRT